MLLDTSAFLWFISGDRRLPAKVKTLIQAKDSEVLLSVVSFWEITVKYGLGKLPLPQSPDLYIPKQRLRHGISELSLDGSAVAHLGRLPLPP
jgi:PIN domain nuclease of toxin-antitoxin system